MKNQPHQSSNRKRIHVSVFEIVLLVAITLFFQTSAMALHLDSVAARNMESYKKFEGLSQNALVLTLQVPGYRYIDRIEIASGELTNGTESSAFLSVGPQWRINRLLRDRYSFLELGISPTWIDDSNFRNETLGGSFFFTSDIKLGVQFGRHRELTVAVRIHHISNAGFASTNPGTDMAGLELAYQFDH